ncbi:hypothetical protein HK104_005391 [Borealophlyctis nickersoniae]|nr:hypothetical protein HK104_005391 [Borealophlyctis nickersoniae]
MLGTDSFPTPTGDNPLPPSIASQTFKRMLMHLFPPGDASRLNDLTLLTTWYVIDEGADGEAVFVLEERDDEEDARKRVIQLVAEGWQAVVAEAADATDANAEENGEAAVDADRGKEGLEGIHEEEEPATPVTMNQDTGKEVDLSTVEEILPAIPKVEDTEQMPEDARVDVMQDAVEGPMVIVEETEETVEEEVVGPTDHTSGQPDVGVPETEQHTEPEPQPEPEPEPEISAETQDLTTKEPIAEEVVESVVPAQVVDQEVGTHPADEPQISLETASSADARTDEVTPPPVVNEEANMVQEQPSDAANDVPDVEAAVTGSTEPAVESEPPAEETSVAPDTVELEKEAGPPAEGSLEGAAVDDKEPVVTSGVATEVGDGSAEKSAEISVTEPMGGNEVPANVETAPTAETADVPKAEDEVAGAGGLVALPEDKVVLDPAVADSAVEMQTESSADDASVVTPRLDEAPAANDEVEPSLDASGASADSLTGQPNVVETAKEEKENVIKKDDNKPSAARSRTTAAAAGTKKTPAGSTAVNGRKPSPAPSAASDRSKNAEKKKAARSSPTRRTLTPANGTSADQPKPAVARRAPARATSAPAKKATEEAAKKDAKNEERKPATRPVATRKTSSTSREEEKKPTSSSRTVRRTTTTAASASASARSASPATRTGTPEKKASTPTNSSTVRSTPPKRSPASTRTTPPRSSPQSAASTTTQSPKSKPASSRPVTTRKSVTGATTTTTRSVPTERKPVRSTGTGTGAKRPATAAAGGKMKEVEKEVAELRNENVKLKEENEALKKQLADLLILSTSTSNPAASSSDTANDAKEPQPSDVTGDVAVAAEQ